MHHRQTYMKPREDNHGAGAGWRRRRGLGPVPQCVTLTLRSIIKGITFLRGITMAAGDTLKAAEPSRPSCSSAQRGLRSACSRHHLTSVLVKPTASLNFSVNFGGRVPAFEGEDGFCVPDSNAAAYHVSKEGLPGHVGEAAATVVQGVSQDLGVPPWASCTTKIRPQRMHRSR